MTALNKLAEQLKSETQKVIRQIQQIEQAKSEKRQQMNQLLQGKVSKTEFKQHLLERFAEFADSYLSKARSRLNKTYSAPTFESLENKVFADFPFLTGDFAPEEISRGAMFYYFPEQLADRFIALLPDDYFDEQALNKAERQAQINALEAEIDELNTQQNEFIALLESAGINTH